MQPGGRVTNAAGASVSGSVGVQIYSAAGTVTNSGTITGVSHAVQFAGSGNNRLVVGSSGVFIGDIVEVPCSAAPTHSSGRGTMSGLVGNAGRVMANGHTWSFTNFTTLAVDKGTTWTLSEDNTFTTILDNGTLNIGDGGSLAVTGAIDPSSTGAFLLSGNALLDFAGDVGSGVQIVFQGPTGVLELADIATGVVRSSNADDLRVERGKQRHRSHQRGQHPDRDHQRDPVRQHDHRLEQRNDGRNAGAGAAPGSGCLGGNEGGTPRLADMTYSSPTPSSPR